MVGACKPGRSLSQRFLFDERASRIFFRFSQLLPFSVRHWVLSVIKCKMSAVKKLCSIIFKSSRSIVTLKKRELYTTNCETLSSHNVVVMTNVQNRQLVSGGYQVKNYSQALGTLTKDQAHDLVFRLNEEERTTLYNTLEQFQMKEDKVKMECEFIYHNIFLILIHYSPDEYSFYVGWQNSLIRLSQWIVVKLFFLLIFI